VKSAARAEPLPEDAPQKMSKERLKEGAAETALNAAGILRDLVDDFQNSDRFFKYKAAVLAGWLLLSVTSLGVACPGSDSKSVGSIDARLVISDVAGQRVYLIKNDSEGTWENVSVVVNQNYQTTAAQIAPYGDIGLSPRLLVDPNTGKSAPSDLVFSQIEVHCDQGAAVLLKGGQRL
jgi:hypothetical protein